jgi:Spx/MgsR family transcriptional regulator
VKKARFWLDEHGIAYEFHDFKKLGIDESTLKNWLSQINWEKLVNRAGMTWRGLSDTEKAAVVDNDSAINLMIDNTSVIKRPLLVKNYKILNLGFDEDSYRKLFT